ncbi:hypothetical protein BS47DRAFT_1360874 [Hydnum rufescens UP504]|uniref:Uncharacterized protein n=1 Tax=Hydnum rufescens UP504 TaxID=1448309 RepID=A0A9P6B0T1_9AGAM|nr:hypothetical protein BS47DRAFT_1360874 [Hydnum rufescens UP504]
MTETVIPQSTGASVAEAAAAGQQAFVPPQGPPPAYDERELPAGWTESSIQRSVWVHPLGILAQHVDQQHGGNEDEDDDDDDRPEEPIPERPATLSPKKRESSTSSYPADVKRRPDEEYRDVSAPSVVGPFWPRRPVVLGSRQKRGLIGRLRDGVFGSKEERKTRRALRKARHREEERLYMERRNALMAQRQRELEAEREAYRRSGGQYGQSGYYGGGQYGYCAPSPNAYGGPAYNNQYGYGPSDPYYNRRRGGGGLGLPLLGGLLGGMLLGDLLF